MQRFPPSKPFRAAQRHIALENIIIVAMPANTRSDAILVKTHRLFPRGFWLFRTLLPSQSAICSTLFDVTSSNKPLGLPAGKSTAFSTTRDDDVGSNCRTTSYSRL